MPVIHFLNVNNGDCSILQHGSGRVTVIDVCNARAETPFDELSETIDRLVGQAEVLEKGVAGNFQQKKYPVNPIRY